jgi:hemerythrin-like domain-containing protein
MLKLLDQLSADHERWATVLSILEGEFAKWTAGDEPDRSIPEACFNYCTNYYDHCHHPRDDLIEAHRALADLTRGFLRRVQDVLHEPGSGPEDVEAKAADFLAEYRKHMRWENEAVFPEAKRVLTAAD